MRRLAVSDIHGYASKLESVLQQAGYNPDRDRLFLLGDYIDRGPEIRRTVELCIGLQRQGAVALLGNHDCACMLSWKPEMYEIWTRPGNGGDLTLSEYGGRVPRRVLRWFERLPLWHEEPDCILVHAGFRPGVQLLRQNPHDLLWIREEFWFGYRGKLVIFGHTPTNILHGKPAPWYGLDKIGIDTGACYTDEFGGCLTLFDLDTHDIWQA